MNRTIVCPVYDVVEDSRSGRLIIKFAPVRGGKLDKYVLSDLMSNQYKGQYGNQVVQKLKEKYTVTSTGKYSRIRDETVWTTDINFLTRR